MRVRAVQCVLIAIKLSARPMLVALEFTISSLTAPDCSVGPLLLVAQERLIRYAGKVGLTRQWGVV